jgi:hypothetical protein
LKAAGVGQVVICSTPPPAFLGGLGVDRYRHEKTGDPRLAGKFVASSSCGAAAVLIGMDQSTSY